MSPEVVISRIIQKIPFLHRTDTQAAQTPVREVITSETVNAELLRLKNESSGNQSHPIDSKSADQVRQTLSVTGVEFQPGDTLTVFPTIQPTGLTVLSIREAHLEGDTLKPDPNSRIDRVSIKLALNASSNASRAQIDTFVVVNKDGSSIITPGYKLRDTAASLDLIHILAQACLASAPAQPQA